MSPFVRPRELAHPTLRLVAFHHAGGSAATYYPLTRKLPPHWDLAILDLPGRGKRHGTEPLTHMQAVVERAVQDIESLSDVPLALFGHSFGAMVASEVARVLDARGVSPVWLGVSGRAAPSESRAAQRRLHELSDTRLLGELFELGALPPRIQEVPEFCERFLAVVRADLTAVESYVASPERRRLSCPITAFSGRTDPWALPAIMSGWALETHGPFTQRIFRGGHFYFMGEAFDELTTQLTSSIVRAAEGRDPAPRSAALP